MSKEISDESVQDILDMWRDALEKSGCVARYKIEGKVIDYDLIPDGEENCDGCTSPFCFKKLEWDDSQEYESSKDGMSPPKILKTVEIELTDTNEWERAYV